MQEIVNWCNKTIEFKENRSVGKSALSLKLLNINKKSNQDLKFFLQKMKLKKQKKFGVWLMKIR